ncbi:MAG: ABC transporter permease [Deltaproteobacteria bacterium]|nr:ABC transporter permease [Deltaproteobacteria bacterium]
MNYHEAFLSALSHLASHKLRSALTTLGVVFGVGAVIAMLSIGAGAELQAQGMIERLGLKNVLIRAETLAGDQLQEARKKSAGLSFRDSEAILDAVPGVAGVAPKVEIDPYAIVAGTTTAEGLVYGVSESHGELAGLRLSRGRFLDAWDVRDHAQVCVVGKGLAEELFGFTDPLGSWVKVNDVWLRVVGILTASGGEADSFEGVPLGGSSRAIYVPVTTALRKFDRDALESPLTELIVRLDEASEGPSTARVIGGLLERLHAGVDDYQLVVPEALLEQSRRTQKLFNLVMGCIAGISLLVGGIGIMNIMLATVMERTREIGIRRAVGARKRDVLVQFMVESFTISAVGGLAGIVMGLLIAKGIAASAGWPTVVTPSSILLATGVAITVGLASGIYPARRAAELDPIESLRYE